MFGFNQPGADLAREHAPHLRREIEDERDVCERYISSAFSTHESAAVGDVVVTLRAEGCARGISKITGGLPCLSAPASIRILRLPRNWSVGTGRPPGDRKIHQFTSRVASRQSSSARSSCFRGHRDRDMDARRGVHQPDSSERVIRNPSTVRRERRHDLGRWCCCKRRQSLSPVRERQHGHVLQRCCTEVYRLLMSAQPASRGAGGPSCEQRGWTQI